MANDITYNYLASEKVKVFPCAYRGKTDTTQIDADSRLNSEYNLTRPHAEGKRSYIFNYTLNGTAITGIQFILGGYYFELKGLVAEDINLINNKYAYIKINNNSLSNKNVTAENYEKCLINLATNKVESLDTTTSETYATFKGLGFSADDQAESETLFRIKLVVNNQINKTAYIRTEFGFVESWQPEVAITGHLVNGAGESSIVQLNKKADTLIGEATNQAIGINTIALGDNSIAGSEGSGKNAIATGHATEAKGANSLTGGDTTKAYGTNSIAFGNETTAGDVEDGTKGKNAVALGQKTIATGTNSIAEGYETKASGECSHAEGYGTTASGKCSHVEGNGNIASGECSHAEGGCNEGAGEKTQATGIGSHAEGSGTIASGMYSHAEGDNTEASGNYAHVEGFRTKANHKSQHVFGEYNIIDTSTTTAAERGNYVEIVGNGASGSLSNARTLDWNGNEWLAGRLNTNQVQGNSNSTLQIGHNNDKTYAEFNEKNINIYANGSQISNISTFGISFKKSVVIEGDDIDIDIDIAAGSGSITTNGPITAGSFNATSDKRLKENIEEFKTEKSILDLPVYRYDFINGAKNQIGCLAQDLQKICPEIVSENKDGYLSIQESKLIYLLLKEVKELKEEIKKLKGE